jgi:hypothetical protein
LSGADREPHEDEMITRILPDELMDEILALEGAYPVKVGVHELPFTKCDWTTAKVLIVLSFSFSETGRGIVSNVGSEVWTKIQSVIQRLQQSAGPQDRVDVQFSVQVNNTASVRIDVNIHKVFAALPMQVSGQITYLSQEILSGRLQGSSVTLRLWKKGIENDRLTAPFTVLRLLTPLKMTYEAAKTRAEPYTKIVEELREMRRDTVELVKKAVGEKRKAYVLVNNRSEGNAPLTI